MDRFDDASGREESYRSATPRIMARLARSFCASRMPQEASRLGRKLHLDFSKSFPDTSSFYIAWSLFWEAGNFGFDAMLGLAETRPCHGPVVCGSQLIRWKSACMHPRLRRHAASDRPHGRCILTAPAPSTILNVTKSAHPTYQVDRYILWLSIPAVLVTGAFREDLHQHLLWHIRSKPPRLRSCRVLLPLSAPRHNGK